MNPVLKYRGGKSREIPHFLSHIPNYFHRYLEPFFGGGAVYFHLEPSQAILGDINERLMTFYRQLRDNYPRMRRQLDELEKQYESNQTAYQQEKKKTQVSMCQMPMKASTTICGICSIIPMGFIWIVCSISLSIKPPIPV